MAKFLVLWLLSAVTAAFATTTTAEGKATTATSPLFQSTRVRRGAFVAGNYRHGKRSTVLTRTTLSWLSAARQQEQEEGAKSLQPQTADGIDADVEAEKIVQKLEATEIPSAGGVPEFSTTPERKYQPSLDPQDPIVQAITQVLKAPGPVTSFELLDSRWNGNEVFCYRTAAAAGEGGDSAAEKKYFVKMNRVEDASVMLSEAVSLSALLQATSHTKSLHVPKPLHIGKLPKVGNVGPGCFLILEWMPLKPFASMRSNVQRQLAHGLADLHLSTVHQDLHQGRFGFPTSNYLAITPLNNTWCESWTDLFARRLGDQVEALHADKTWGRRALTGDDSVLVRQGRVIVACLSQLLATEQPIQPSLIHGDLWIGNTGAIASSSSSSSSSADDSTLVPVLFDPACCFAHSEFELGIMKLFSGYSDTHFWNTYHQRIPKTRGFERRAKVYAFYHYLNQLNIFGDATVYQTCQSMAQDILQDIDFDAEADQCKLQTLLSSLKDVETAAAVNKNQEANDDKNEEDDDDNDDEKTEPTTETPSLHP